MSLVSPLLGSDCSVDCRASTCYCLLSGDMFGRAVFSTTLASLRMDRHSGVSWNTKASLLYLSPPPPLLLSDPSSIWKICSAPRPIAASSWEIELTWAANCQRNTRLWWVFVAQRNYRAVLICGHTYTCACKRMQAHDSCMCFQSARFPSRLVCHWPAVQRESVGQKNTGCEVTMVTACPGAWAVC